MPKKAIRPFDKNASEVLRNLGERLKFCRLSRNDSIMAMAERLQCSPNTYIALEKGMPTVSIGTLVNVLAILGELHTLDLVAAISAERLSSHANIKRRVSGKNPTLPSADEVDF